jgi:hypothetical protein
MHRVHPGGAGAAELADSAASVVKLRTEPMGDSRGGGLERVVARRKEHSSLVQRAGASNSRDACDAMRGSVPEVPAGGAKPERGRAAVSPSAKIDRSGQDVIEQASGTGVRRRRVQSQCSKPAGRCDADRLRVVGGCKDGGQVARSQDRTGRRDLPGRARQIAGAIAARERRSERTRRNSVGLGIYYGIVLRARESQSQRLSCARERRWRECARSTEHGGCLAIAETPREPRHARR